MCAVEVLCPRTRADGGVRPVICDIYPIDNYIVARDSSVFSTSSGYVDFSVREEGRREGESWMGGGGESDWGMAADGTCRDDSCLQISLYSNLNKMLRGFQTPAQAALQIECDARLIVSNNDIPSLPERCSNFFVKKNENIFKFSTRASVRTWKLSNRPLVHPL